ncbi:MAG TPA: DUF2330 domain-containing protein [Reyranella sp.]|nr:DUF2330 domain-containing protein [Reyranella sp.]
MMRRLLAIAALAMVPAHAHAFCGFYVGKADSSLFNEASQVILARDGQTTTLSMRNDYRGDPSEFALVVPVPVVLKKEDVKVLDAKVFQHLDDYSAPRLVEYHDEDPCAPPRPMMAMAPPPAAMAMAPAPKPQVKVEAFFTVGEFDIVILSAEESDALESWLTTNGYNIPKGASDALRPYVRQGMKFFVARVNLKAHDKGGSQYLSPLQFSFSSPKFMLPMRLGMLNAKGPQDLIVYTLTRSGRVEATNYQTTPVPTAVDLPLYVRDQAVFKDFYKTMFDRMTRADGYRKVYTEYVWAPTWCDPCAAPPPTMDELAAAGARWIVGSDGRPTGRGDVTLTRLHLRYTPESFPEDLVFQQTADRGTFQARYVLHHPWSGGNPYKCSASIEYYRELGKRMDGEAESLAKLTGWKLEDIKARMPRMSLIPAQ